MAYHTAAAEQGRPYLTVRARDIRHGRDAYVAQSERRNSERAVVSLVWLFSTVLEMRNFTFLLYTLQSTMIEETFSQKL